MGVDANSRPRALESKRDLFRETLVVMDDKTWIWNMVSTQLERLGRRHIRLPSSVPLRSSWARFAETDFIILHWEGKERGGGAIIEEILEVDRFFDIRNQMIVLTAHPTHEDVVYFSELGVRKIVRIRHRDKDMVAAMKELTGFLAADRLTPEEASWNSLLHLIDQLQTGTEVKPERVVELESMLHSVAKSQNTARYLDAVGSISSLRGQDDKALQSWHEALGLNPNYVRSYQNMVIHHRLRGALKEAYALMQKMYELNKANISRLIDMGEIQGDMGDLGRAEFYFQSALARDPYASRALNGLAEIKFHQGHLDTSRELLAKSQLAHKTAHNLNREGVLLVQKGLFENALDHYTKALYVLPQQDKGPLLLYNIALCYIKWRKPESAREYALLALIKDPKYDKARKLIQQIDQITKANGPSGRGGPMAPPGRMSPLAS